MMKQMRNILLTCAGGAGTLALAHSLQPSFTVFLADGNDRIAAKHAGFPFRKIPLGLDPSFPDSMRTLIHEWNIDYVVPGADEELLPMARLRDAKVVRCVMPESAFVETCINKKLLMRALHEHGISSLLPFETEGDVRYPAIAKPVIGRGSRQVHRIDSDEQLKGYLQLYGKKFADVLVQPFIGGEEYTVSVIVNNLNKLLGIIPKRVLEKRGITQVAVTERNEQISEMCSRIVEELKPHGPFNVQLMTKNAACYVFEINPRLSTTAVLTDRAFGNEIKLYIDHFDEEQPSPSLKLKEGILLLRGIENIFIDQASG